MNKARSSGILVVVALVVLAAISICFDGADVEELGPTADGFPRALEADSLPSLSEPIPDKPQTSEETSSDNSTAAVSSGGAVEASFTVVSQPSANQGESGASSIYGVVRDPNGSSVTGPAQAVNGLVVDDWPAQNDRSGTAAEVVRPKSGGLITVWVLLTTICSLGIAAIGTLALLRLRARE